MTLVEVPGASHVSVIMDLMLARGGDFETLVAVLRKHVAQPGGPKPGICSQPPRCDLLAQRGEHVAGVAVVVGAGARVSR